LLGVVLLISSFILSSLVFFWVWLSSETILLFWSIIIVGGVVNSSIGLSHNRPNQSSEQIHANLRAECGTVSGDSTHLPRSPHGLIGVHNEDDGASVVELDSVVVEDHEDVVVGHEDVVVGNEDVVVGNEDVVSVVLSIGEGGAARDGQLHATRSSSQTRKPHERK